MNDNLILTALAATKAGPGASRTDILANLATIVDLAGELDEIGPALADAATFAPAGARGEFLAELLSCRVPAGKDGHRRGSSIIRGATVVKVERINRGGHDKCQVTYRALSYYDMKRKRKLAEPVMSEDTITTDWLSNPEAQAVEARAGQLAGAEGGADLWKHLVGAADDTEKKDGDQDDGFKELFYISNAAPTAAGRPTAAPARTATPAPAPQQAPATAEPTEPVSRSAQRSAPGGQSESRTAGSDAEQRFPKTAKDLVERAHDDFRLSPEQVKEIVEGLVELKVLKETRFDEDGYRLPRPAGEVGQVWEEIIRQYGQGSAP